MSFKSIMLLSKVTLLAYIFSCLADNSNVVDLDDKNFKSAIVSYRIALVMFYAPWCSHCKNLTPKFEKASRELQDYPQITLAKVDCTGEGRNTCEKYFINEYPYLSIYRYGVFVKKYKLAREKEDMVSKMRIEANKSLQMISTIDDFNKTLHESIKLVIGFFSEQTNLESEYFKVGEILADKYKLTYITSKELIEQHGIENGIAIFAAPQLENPFEQSIIKYSGIDKYPNILHFVIKNYHGLVGYRTTKNKGNFAFPIVIALYKSNNDNDYQRMYYWRRQIVEVASKFYRNITFAVSPQTKKELRQYGINNAGEEVIIVARDVRNEKFICKEEFSVENLEKFVNDVLNGRLKPYRKSEPLPSSNSSTVKQAVALNFQELVIENNRDTFIGFYAPWCPYCRSIANDYEALARLLSEEDVDIVRMDATANDVPYLFKVRAYPTAYWVPKNAKYSPVLYRGKRTVKDVLKFIASHATHKLKGYDREGIKISRDEL